MASTSLAPILTRSYLRPTSTPQQNVAATALLALLCQVTFGPAPLLQPPCIISSTSGPGVEHSTRISPAPPALGPDVDRLFGIHPLACVSMATMSMPQCSLRSWHLRSAFRLGRCLLQMQNTGRPARSASAVRIQRRSIKQDGRLLDVCLRACQVLHHLPASS